MSLPGGFTVRDVSRNDIDSVAAIARAEEAALRGNSLLSPADMSDFLRYANFEGGSWIVDREDVAVAFAANMYREDGADCWATVHPDWTGRGLGTFLLHRVEEHARQGHLRRIRGGTFAENERAHALFAALGYREARHFFQMRIDLDAPPEQPQWPDGVGVATFGPEDARDFHGALNDAFAEEWGFHQTPFDEWRRVRLEAPDTDTSLWFIVRGGNQVAAVARCDANRDGGGWVGAIGVLKPWRRRGIALALLRHIFGEFHRRGEPHVGLGVDAENPTNATRLYERAGMRVMKEDVVYEKELS